MKISEELHRSLIVNCVFNGFLSCTAIVLNVITIHAMRNIPSLPKPLKTLLFSLSVSDLGVGLLVQPLYIVYLAMKMKPEENNPTYIVYLALLTLFIYASFLGLMALSADRFLAIHLHLRYQELVTYRRVVAVVISIWVFSAFLSLIRRLSGTDIVYVIFVVIEVTCIVIATFLNYKIYLAVRRHTNQIQALQVQQAPQNSETAANAERLRKSAVGTFYVYLVFLVTYLPRSCIILAIRISPSLTAEVWSIYILTLVFLNSSLNPLIYCWKMRHIRHAVLNILRNAFSAGHN